jgi:excisionase family DNA binding protein
MTEYEMRKIAKMQAELFAESLKNDPELLDLMYPPRLMNIEEAAEYLRIPVGTLYQKANEIPHEKVGKRLIFSDRGLIRWMKRSCRDAAVEIPMSRKAM